MDTDLKNQVKRHGRYLKTSCASFLVGLGIVGVSSLWPNPERPEIYREFSSAQDQVSQLERTKKELGDVLSAGENVVFSQLEEAINKRQERIAEIEKIPEFQGYQETYKKLKKKKDASWYTGLGILVAGYIGFLRSFSRASRIRREYEKHQEVKSE